MLKKLVAALKSPEMRPLEIWALRAVIGLVAAKLGIDLAELVG